MQADALPQWPAGNVAALVVDAARTAPGREALVDSRRRVTWDGLAEESAAVAGGLSGLGLVAGHRVAILLENRVELVATLLGALGAGLVAVPLNPRSPTGEIVRVLADSGARVVVCDAQTATGTRAAVDGLADALRGADEQLRARAVVPRVVVVDAPRLPGEAAYADLRAATGTAVQSPQDPEALAVLLYTAGTSGRPRAAMHTHRSLLAGIEQAARIDPAPLRGTDRVLGVLPLFHVYGLTAVLGQVLRHRACLVLTERFDADETLRLIEDESVTDVPVAPPALSAWASRDDLGERMRSVRTVLTGASPLAPEVARRFEQASGVPVHQGYGMTEAAAAVSTTLAAPGRPKRASVGRPIPGVEVSVVDEAGHPATPEDPGEVWVRGANLFAGYWPDGEGAPGPQGWYGTGDIGYVDDDGDLFLVDRVREVVVVSGFTVYPAEIEEVIGEVEGVDEVAVVGVADADGVQQVEAYVVADPYAGVTGDRLLAHVREHCDRRLAPFKRPRRTHQVDELPHSVSGRVAKGRLRSGARRRATGPA